MWVVNHFDGDGIIAYKNTKEEAMDVVRAIFAQQVAEDEIPLDEMEFYLENIEQYGDGGGYAVYEIGG